MLVSDFQPQLVVVVVDLVDFARAPVATIVSYLHENVHSNSPFFGQQLKQLVTPVFFFGFRHLPIPFSFVALDLVLALLYSFPFVPFYAIIRKVTLTTNS